MTSDDVEDASREELEERVRELERTVERLSEPEYLKALVRQVLREDHVDDEDRAEELEHTVLPIQKVARLPEEIADDQLSPNQYRARYVWENFGDFSHGVRNGRVVKAGELRRILQARDDENTTVESTTVRRVMSVFVDLTNDIAEVQRSGDNERRLYVPNDWRRQAQADSTDGGDN